MSDSSRRVHFRHQEKNKSIALPSSTDPSKPMITTTMNFTPAHHPSLSKVLPFSPEETGYLLTEDQRRSMEQSFRITKLLLHRLKRLLIEV